MNVYDEDGNVVENPDLSAGSIIERTRIRPDAEPIDNEKKHAWLDEDYETVLVYVKNDEYKVLRTEITGLKRVLEETDYVACKTMDMLAACETAEEFAEVITSVRESYSGVLASRAEARKRINELEMQLASIGVESVGKETE